MEDKDTKAKTKAYRVAERFLNDGKTPVTLVDGVAVSLNGKDLVKELPGTLSRPPETVTVKAVTQAQLKKLHAERHEMIEEYEV